MASILLESIMLQEGPLNPAEMKTKLGIKADSISDEDMQTLMDVTTDKKQLVALVKFAIETKDLPKVITYGTKMAELDPKLDPQRFPTFIKYTEYLDAKISAHGYQRTGASFELDSQKPDWESTDHRYKVYDAKDVSDCIKYGHGQTFCISRNNGGNMYYHYRKNQGSKYYFVFDTSLNPADEKYITVVDAQSNGEFEFTHKSNDTAGTSKLYNNSLKQFGVAKPGLDISIFKPNPVTAAEKAEYERWEDISNVPNGFIKLNYQDKHRYILTGMYPLFKMDEFQSLDKFLRNEYINMGLHVGDDVFPCFEDALKIRIVKANNNDTLLGPCMNMADFASQHWDKFKYNLTVTEIEDSNVMARGMTQKISMRMSDPTPIFNLFTKEQWLDSFKTQFLRKIWTPFSFIKNKAAWVNLLGAEIMGQAETDIDIYRMRKMFMSPSVGKSIANSDVIPWGDMIDKEITLFTDVLLQSPAANEILAAVEKKTGKTWDEIRAILISHFGADDKNGSLLCILVNLALTSDNPLQGLKKYNLLKPSTKYYFYPSGLKTLFMTPLGIIALKELIKVDGINEDTILAVGEDMDPQVIQSWCKMLKTFKADADTSNNKIELSENYLLRFNKILSS